MGKAPRYFQTRCGDSPGQISNDFEHWHQLSVTPSLVIFYTLTSRVGWLIHVYSTLIDSTPGVYKAWETFASDYSLGDPLKVAHATHGRRLHDTLKEYCNIQDETKLQVTAIQINCSYRC